MIRVPASSREEGEEEDEVLEDGPGFASSKSGKSAANPFALVGHLATGFSQLVYHSIILVGYWNWNSSIMYIRE